MSTFQIDFGESRRSKIVGIDLGTTNSLVAYMDLTGPKIVEDAEGRKIVPSVVSLTESGQLVAGEEARELLLTASDRTVYSVKRLMGKGVADVQQEIKLFPFRIDPSSDFGYPTQTGRPDSDAAGNFRRGVEATQAERRSSHSARRCRRP